MVLVIGITLINNYEKMTGLETALRELTDSLEQQDTELKAAYADLGQAEDGRLRMELRLRKIGSDNGGGRGVRRENGCAGTGRFSRLGRSYRRGR